MLRELGRVRGSKHWAGVLRGREYPQPVPVTHQNRGCLPKGERPAQEPQFHGCQDLSQESQRVWDHVLLKIAKRAERL